MTFLQLLLLFCLSACTARLISEALPKPPARYSRLRLTDREDLSDE